MEWIFSKKLIMFRYYDKIFIKFCFLSVLMLMISERCWSLFPQPLQPNSEKETNFLADVPIPNNTLTTLKPKCYHTAADGSISHFDCPTTVPPDKESLTRNESQVNETNPTYSNQNNTDVFNLGFTSPNVTSINTAKALCNNTDSNKTSDCHIHFPIKDHLLNKVFPNETTYTTNSSKENSSNVGTTGTTTENSEIASMNDHFHKYKGGLDVDENLNTTNNKKNVVHSRKNSSENKLPTDRNHQKGNNSGNNDASRLNKENSVSKHIFSTKAAGIAAGICLTVASLAYISLMVWRKISYQHYGNREMLLNEDDLGDIHDEDMRHFELKLLNKDGKVIES